MDIGHWTMSIFRQLSDNDGLVKRPCRWAYCENLCQLYNDCMIASTANDDCTNHQEPSKTNRAPQPVLKRDHTVIRRAVGNIFSSDLET